MAIRFIITSDLHQNIGKWNDLVGIVKQEKPRFVLIAGDLLPKSGGFKGQQKFFPVLADYFEEIRRSGNTTILTFFGNDDYHPLEPLLDNFAAKGLCINLNGRVHREEGFVFCGMNRVRDFPFGYKHWCAPDGDFISCPVQFCGEGLTINDKGQWTKLPNLREHLLTKPNLYQQLDNLRSQLTCDEIRRSIWLLHCPPANVGMDICHDSRQVGSPNITRFIEETQPLLGCSGHIHESPYHAYGKWAARIGKTLWFQPGQEGQNLHFVNLDIADEFTVCNCIHSVFGTAEF